MVLDNAYVSGVKEDLNLLSTYLLNCPFPG